MSDFANEIAAEWAASDAEADAADSRAKEIRRAFLDGKPIDFAARRITELAAAGESPVPASGGGGKAVPADAQAQDG